MSTVLVWSERNESRGRGWHDCTYSSYLMALVYGGFTKFPLGIYTAAEREALESSDSRPDETGSNLNNIDEAGTKRYGLKYKLSGSPETTLAIALGKVGTGLVIQGQNGRLPAGHFLRRWDPGFTGGHCVFVQPLGNGKSRWFDPLATWKYAGDIVDNATVIKWAFGVGYTRVVKSNVFAPPPVVVVAKPAIVRVLAGRYHYYAVVRGQAKLIGILKTGGFSATYKKFIVKQTDGTGTTTLLLITSGVYKGKYIWRYDKGIVLK